MSGLHEYRFKQNPEERRFAKAWKKFAANNLGHLLHVGDQKGRPPDPNDRDAQVAATVIQWLGSPVGQHWLADLGYERTGKRRT